MDATFRVPAGRLPRPARGFLFDTGGVLYDATLWQRWLWQLLRRMGVQADYQRLFDQWQQQYLPEVYGGRCLFAAALRSFLRQQGLSSAQSDEVEAACQARRHRLETTNRPLPGVKSTLARLHHAGAALGVLTDSELPSELLAHRLSRSGLDALFRAVVSSFDLKRILPAAECYAAAVSALELPAERIVFVGNRAEPLAGAARAGLMTVACRAAEDVHADVHLDRFDLLPDLAPLCPSYAAAFQALTADVILKGPHGVLDLVDQGIEVAGFLQNAEGAIAHGACGD